MRDLYITRNELCDKSNKLQVAKWDLKLTRDQVTDLIKKQDDVYKKYGFDVDSLEEKIENLLK